MTTARMEFEAMEDEANAIHGDLWEQLNAGGQVNTEHNHPDILSIKMSENIQSEEM